MANKFNYSQFFLLDEKYINLAHSDIIGNCNIEIIEETVSDADIQMLIQKNSLQKKVLNHQFGGLIKIWRSAPDYFKTADTTLPEVYDVIINHKTIEKYGDINTLSKAQHYKDTHLFSEFINTYSAFDDTKEFVVMALIQLFILKKQYIQLLKLLQNNKSTSVFDSSDSTNDLDGVWSGERQSSTESDGVRLRKKRSRDDVQPEKKKKARM